MWKFIFNSSTDYEVVRVLANALKNLFNKVASEKHIDKLKLFPINGTQNSGNLGANVAIHSDEGLTLETSVFESFTVANLPYRPCG